MTLNLKIWFLAGRYHATDWNHQVNEGVLEWPPSPWRLYRAFVASYYRLLQRPDRSVLLGLLERLSSVLPHYYLPPTAQGHTRHHMPVWKEGKNHTTLVFDTFLVLGNGAGSKDAVIWMTWPGLELHDSHRELLIQLCERISYLGRAESWVELSILIQLGRVEDYATTLERRIPGVSPLIAKATTWRSLTPMVLPRHFKRNPKLDKASQLLIDSPEHQVLSQIRCLQKHDLLKFSEPEGWIWKNHILVTQEGFDGPYPWYAYQRLRQKGNGSHAGDKAYWVEITFPEAIVGPLALGYAAHFGLGVFMPCLKKWQTTSEVLSADEEIG